MLSEEEWGITCSQLQEPVFKVRRDIPVNAWKFVFGFSLYIPKNSKTQELISVQLSTDDFDLIEFDCLKACLWK